MYFKKLLHKEQNVWNKVFEILRHLPYSSFLVLCFAYDICPTLVVIVLKSWTSILTCPRLLIGVMFLLCLQSDLTFFVDIYMYSAVGTDPISG